MVKTRSMRSGESCVASSSVSNVSSSPAEFGFNRSEVAEVPEFAEAPTQSSNPSFVGRGNVASLKTVHLFRMIGLWFLKKIPTVLGIFGGFHAIYQIYLANIGPQNEKMEIVVLRRSFS